MKILVVGGGSMGRRRLRDLTYLSTSPLDLSPSLKGGLRGVGTEGGGEISLFEPVPARCQEVAAAFGLQGFTDFEEALAAQPEAIVVSTPPALHETYVRRAIELKLPVFAEVPFMLNLTTLAELSTQDSTQAAGAVLGISHTLRYYPPYRLIHDIVQQGLIGRPLYLEYSLGQYLPGWHPYEDYRRFYASDAGLGGAGMDMILHEIAAIQWWLGDIQAVYTRFGKVSSLEIKGPDTQDVLLTFANGCLGFFHHDLIEQGSQGRHIRLTGAEGTLEWHQHQPTLRLYRAAEGKNQELSFQEAPDWPEASQASQEMSEILARQRVASGQPPASGDNTFTYESCYLREMRHFLGAAQGRHPYTIDIAEELQTVRVFQAIVESSQTRQEVQVERET